MRRTLCSLLDMFEHPYWPLLSSIGVSWLSVPRSRCLYLLLGSPGLTCVTTPASLQTRSFTHPRAQSDAAAASYLSLGLWLRVRVSRGPTCQPGASTNNLGCSFKCIGRDLHGQVTVKFLHFPKALGSPTIFLWVHRYASTLSISTGWSPKSKEVCGR